MTKECQQCGQEFEQERSDARFCTDKCRAKNNRTDNRTHTDNRTANRTVSTPEDMTGNQNRGIRNGVWNTEDFKRCSGCNEWVSIKDSTHCNGNCATKHESTHTRL